MEEPRLPPNIVEITRGPLKSVADFIDVADGWPDPMPDATFWPLAFRGQPRGYGALTPSFQRQFTTRSIGAAEIIERRLIDAFRRHYASLPGQGPDMPGISMIGAGNDLACLSLMQHYEIPTRLLDWTGNVWIAAYFACASDPGENGELWVYDRNVFSGDLIIRSGQSEPLILTRRPEETIFEFDPQSSPRMKKQFAHHTVSTSIFSDHASPLTLLDRSIPESKGHYPLTRL